jgi:hypothetical protein
VNGPDVAVDGPGHAGGPGCAGGPGRRWVARGLARLAIVVATALVAFVPAAPAAADPAGPTHYDSRITGITAEDGRAQDEPPVRLEILGGDAFLVVAADPGVEVEVPGYEGEPYVRIAADGTVEVNQRSPARWLNDARYGAEEVDVPADADPAAPPRWEAVASDGEYAWHDHRIHWMSPSLPRQVDAAAGEPQPVADWEVPLVIDGAPVTVVGELWWLPGPTAVVPAALTLLAVVAGIALALLRPGAVPGLLAASALAALAVGVAKNLGLPAGADGEPFLVVLPVLALALTVAGVAVGRRDAAGSVRGRLVAAAGGLPLAVWALLQAGALTRPLVPGPLPAGVVRVVVALLVAAAAAGVLAAIRAALAATALEGEASRPQA